MFTYQIPDGNYLEVVCSTCHGELNPFNQEESLECIYCSNYFKITETGNLDFVNVDLKSSSKLGLANRFFDMKNGEHLYTYWVTGKHKLQKLLKAEDIVIGLEEEIREKVVLDVGCGPDLDSQATENAHITPKFYVGVDYSGNFVERASNKHGSERLKFARASATQLPFKKDAFQISLALFTIHHVSANPLQVLQELSRVSSEKVIVFDHVRSENKFKATLQMAYWKVFDGGEHYLTLSEWHKHLRDSDLVIEKVDFSGILFNHVIKMILIKK